MPGKRKLILIINLSLIILVFSLGVCFSGQAKLLMATTTSTDNTGLLDYLAPMFEKDTGIELVWVAVGTGRALALGRNCDVSVLLVHAPEAEKKFMDSGYGINRRRIMYNDFMVIGPAGDPANIKGLSVFEAFKKIKASRAAFVSRGDDSGTHKKEINIWKSALAAVPDKEGWYIQTGQGMLISARVAAERSAYTFIDRGTYLKFRALYNDDPPLKVMVEGGDEMINQYSSITINPEMCKDTNHKGAERFGRWITSKQAQAAIGNFKVYGFQLFKPNAEIE